MVVAMEPATETGAAIAMAGADPREPLDDLFNDLASRATGLSEREAARHRGADARASATGNHHVIALVDLGWTRGWHAVIRYRRPRPPQRPYATGALGHRLGRDACIATTAETT